MSKIRLFSSLFWAAGIAVFLTIFASAETPQKLKVIKEIQIQGAKNFKERAVRELVKTRPKDFYSESALREDVQSILASGNYDDAEAQTQDLPTGLRVIFKVKEKPMVKKIDFTGNKKLSKSKLKDGLTLKVKEGFDDTKLRNDVQKIKDTYGEKGYPDAKIEPFTTFDDQKNQVAVNFVVTEGNRVLIDKVEFEGVTAFKPKKLRRLMKTKHKKVFDLDKLNKDKEALADFYKNNGYAKVEIGDHRIEYNADRTRITITVPIKEGDRYETGTFEFVGNSVYTDAELQKAVEMKPGKLFKQEKYDETLRNIKEMYLEKGYLYSRIEPEELPDEKAQKMNYRIHIDEGGIVYIDRIFIEGNKKTKEKVFRREILLKPGDPFSSSKLRRSQEKIFNLGFIDDVKPDIQPARDPDKADLVMEIVEGKPGSLSAGAGYSSNDGLVGQLQLSHSNLFGLAQRLNLMWEFGARKQNYELNWTEPWLMDKPVSFGIDLYNTIRQRLFDSDSDPDYTETRTGGGVRLGPRFSDIYTLNLDYAYNHVRISDVKQQFITEIPETTNNTSAFSAELVRDTRDYYFDATRGNRQSIYGQLMGGPLQGDTNLVKGILSSSWFWTTFSVGNYPFVFSLNGRAGAAQEFSPSDTVPIFERFYVGGADSVRGYNSRGEVGPAEGGRIFTVFNAEYKIPLYVENKRRILQFVLFADAGGAWKGAPDVIFRFGQSGVQDQYGHYPDNERFLKSSVGFGLRITTPVFPIRLDWGYGLNHRAGEDVSQIHFTLGNLF